MKRVVVIFGLLISLLIGCSGSDLHGTWNIQKDQRSGCPKKLRFLEENKLDYKTRYDFMSGEYQELEDGYYRLSLANGMFVKDVTMTVDGDQMEFQFAGKNYVCKFQRVSSEGDF